MQLIDPLTLGLVGKALDAATLRQAAHSQNIANANVAGAPKAVVLFEAQLQRVRDALAAGEALSAADIPSATWRHQTLGAGHIELDAEVSALSQNSLHYQTLVKAMSRQLSLVSLAVSDGKR